jgi:hypothetical protein
MGLRRLSLVVVALLTAAGAYAGDHKADMFFAASYVNAPGSSINLGGWHVSAALTPIKEHKSFGLVADLSAHFLGGEEDGGAPLAGSQKQLIEITFMVGPRWTPLGGQHKYPLMPFVHLMVLGINYRAGGSHPAEMAAAITGGAGFDWTPGDHKTWGFRFEADYIQPLSSDLSHSWRLSAGLVRRLHFHD